MRTLLVFPFVVMTCGLLKGQNTFVKGYVVTEKGDTLKGEVRFNPKKEHEVYSKVFFKDASGMQKNYKPDKTKAYGFEGKHFVAMESDGEKMFFQVVVKGQLNLYKQIVESMKMNEPVYETDYYLAKAGETKLVMIKESKFKKQLAEFMKDAPEIAASYEEEKKFDLDKAVEVINKYNSSK